MSMSAKQLTKGRLSLHNDGISRFDDKQELERDSTLFLATMAACGRAVARCVVTASKYHASHRTCTALHTSLRSLSSRSSLAVAEDDIKFQPYNQRSTRDTDISLDLMKVRQPCNSHSSTTLPLPLLVRYPTSSI